MFLERGSLLNNRYQIIEILGQGGMGSVYRAVDQNLGVDVAVKDNLFITEEYARQFKREAVILATLRHPNLPRVTDHFVIDGQGQYLIMDYIDGEDLRQRMDRVGQLAEDETIIIGSAICDALTYLASRNPPVVHRDIKPGNVRITPSGNIYLVDFGLAKDLRSHQTTATGARAMTPGYSPPEQYGTARTDQRSDIYSLGATLYAALTGNIPEDAISRAVDHVELIPIRKHNPRVSRRLASAIEKALSIRADERYQTAEQFKRALQNASTPSKLRSDEYIVPPPPSFDDLAIQQATPVGGAELVLPFPGNSVPSLKLADQSSNVGSYRASKPYRKSPVRRLTIMALITIIFTSLLVAIFTINRPIDQYYTDFIKVIPPEWGFNLGLLIPSQTEQTNNILLETEETARAIAQVYSEFTPTATSKPTNTPYSSPTPIVSATTTPSVTPLPSSTPTTTLTSTATITPTPLPTALGGGAGQVAFASDRETRLPQIWLVNTDGENLRQLTDLEEGACQPNWSPDGKQLLFISPCDRNKRDYPGSAIFLIPDPDAEEIELVPLPTLPGGDYDPAWSPGGDQIAFTSIRNTGRPRIFFMHLSDNSVSEVTDYYDRSFQPAWSPDGQDLAYVVDLGLGRIYMMSLENKADQQLSNPATATDLVPTWSPDGNIILFTRYPSSSRMPRLVALTLDGENDREVEINLGPIPLREAKFSPDGLWLVFESWPEGVNHDIFIMTTNGTSRRPLTNHPLNDFDPAWRPFIQ